MIRFLLGAAVAFLLITASGCNDGRNHGSNIPIGGPDGCGGTGGAGGGTHCALICDGDDVCGVTGVEECCTDCEVCEVCEVCETCETCETCEICEICEPEIVTVYLCKEWVEVCPKTFCTKTFGHCECTYERQWVPCEGPDND